MGEGVDEVSSLWLASIDWCREWEAADSVMLCRRELGPELEDAPLVPFGDICEIESFLALVRPAWTGLMSGEGRTLFARASAVVLRFLRILEPDLAMSASGEAVGVLLDTAPKAGDAVMACAWP